MKLPKVLPCLLLPFLSGADGEAQNTSGPIIQPREIVTAKPKISAAIVGGYTVDVRPVEVPEFPHHLRATLNAYMCESQPLSPLKPHLGSIGDDAIYSPEDAYVRVIHLDEKLKEGDTICVLEEIRLDCDDFLNAQEKSVKETEQALKDAGKDFKSYEKALEQEKLDKYKNAGCSSMDKHPLYYYSVSEPKPADPKTAGPQIAQPPLANPYTASPRSGRTYARITTGVDVSAASSADPAANFMADLSIDVPFANLDSSLYRRYSANGYLRLASIAQPGKINGIATPATYIKPLTDSTPNGLVQSWEGNVALAWNITPHRYLGEQDAYWTTSAIVDGGFITPISASQTDVTPTVYVANKALFDYYTTAPVPSAAASKAITDACVVPASGSFPTCYVAYIPQDRTRFFRNYAAGFTFKRYRYQGNDNLKTNYPGADKFDFPGTATIKIGQNEYVTKGQARGLVLHGDVFWPIPGILGGKWQGTLYVFGQIDTHLSKNESSQQFILPTAGSAITRTSPNLAIIPVQQPDRDRYRFGVAIDLTTLIKAIGSVNPK